MALAAIILLLSLIGLVYGLFLGLFRKGKRRRGWVVTAVCLFFLLPLSVSLVPETDETNEGNNIALADDRTSGASGADNLNGFPDRRSFDDAAALGIQRYEAYQRFSDQKAIKRYCGWATASYEIELAKQSAMDAANSDAKQTEVWEQYDQQQKDLLAEVNSDLGLLDYELSTLSNAGYWDWHCRAKEREWQVLTLAQAKSASSDDADKAREAAEAFYIYALNNRLSHFFNPDEYNAVNCTWKRYEEFKIVGCRLEAVGRKSDWDIYAVGRSSLGLLLVSPLVGTTQQHISQSGLSEELDKRASARRFFNAYDEFKAYFALFAGPPFNVGEVRNKFPD